MMGPSSPIQRFWRINSQKRFQSRSQPIQRPIPAPKSVQGRARARRWRLRGVPTRVRLRIRNPRLKPHTWISCRLRTLAWPRTKIRRNPPAELMRERSLHQLAPPSLQPSPRTAPDPPPIRIHGRIALLFLPLSIPSDSFPTSLFSVNCRTSSRLDVRPGRETSALFWYTLC